MSLGVVKPKFINSFKDIEVYKFAYDISKKIHSRSIEFPKTEQYSLADQMRRASRSICANIAEGYAKQKYSKKEFARFISMSIGSCSEMLVWIDYSLDFGYISSAEADIWKKGI